MTASKSNAQRKKEAELSVLKNTSNSNNSLSAESVKIFDDLSKQAHKSYEQKDYVSAIGILKRMLEINPKENKTHFNLACCFSLSQNKDGFNSLSKAVEYGYTNIDRIKTYNALEWLRNQTEYEQFVQNGYKLLTNTAIEPVVNKEPISTNTTTTLNDNVFSQIEKLGKLKEQGLITDEEFQQQKIKLLN